MVANLPEAAPDWPFPACGEKVSEANLLSEKHTFVKRGSSSKITKSILWEFINSAENLWQISNKKSPGSASINQGVPFRKCVCNKGSGGHCSHCWCAPWTCVKSTTVVKTITKVSALHTNKINIFRIFPSWTSWITEHFQLASCCSFSFSFNCFTFTLVTAKVNHPACLRCFPPESLQGEHQRRLYKELMANYNRLERPVLNDSSAILVELGLTLLQIIDVVREGGRCFSLWFHFISFHLFCCCPSRLTANCCLVGQEMLKLTVAQ